MSVFLSQFDEHHNSIPSIGNHKRKRINRDRKRISYELLCFGIVWMKMRFCSFFSLNEYNWVHKAVLCCMFVCRVLQEVRYNKRELNNFVAFKLNFSESHLPASCWRSRKKTGYLICSSVFFCWNFFKLNIFLIQVGERKKKKTNFYAPESADFHINSFFNGS